MLITAVELIPLFYFILNFRCFYRNLLLITFTLITALKKYLNPTEVLKLQ